MSYDFPRIREHYRSLAADIAAGEADPYAWCEAGIELTPIEFGLWQDIRAEGAVFYPPARAHRAGPRRHRDPAQVPGADPGMTHDREPGPYELQLSAAFLRALKARARQPGPLPPYVPDSLHGYLLRVKSRHTFQESATA